MKFIKRIVILLLILTILGLGCVFGSYLYLKPQLPNIEELKDVKLETPLQVFANDGQLMAQFGEKRRIPVTYDEIPKHLIEALVATEDSRFFEHHGIDPIGILRAVYVVLVSGEAKQGASTITQQLARNFFLSNQKHLIRKIKEAFIAIHIEQILTKKEIMELYVNKIFLGYRSYGFAAAAQVYYGKSLNELNLNQIATLAGMPKAPSTMNPIYSLKRATARRNVVLARMLDEGYISQAEYQQTLNEPIVASYHDADATVYAPYAAELIRSYMVKQFGEEVYNSGLKIYTTIDPKLQAAAQKASIDNLLAYDERHGYRGAERVLWQSGQQAMSIDAINAHLDTVPTYGDLIPAVVLHVSDDTADVEVKDKGTQSIPWKGIMWARRFLTDNSQGSAPTKPSDVLTAGQQIWVRQITPPLDTDADKNLDEKEAQAEQSYWALSQVPNAQTAFVAMNPDNGSVLALVGGFNFTHNKFNRVTMSVRQVGSSIKPFIYSAGIDEGMTLSTLINDAPINQWDKSQGTAWRPKNSPATYMGPTRLRIGLAQSKNVMAVRLLRAIGLEKTREYLTRFGFDMADLPQSETIALGAGSLTPLQMVQGFSVFANGGYLIVPHFINRIDSPLDEPLFAFHPNYSCHDSCQTDLAEHLTEKSNEAGIFAVNGPQTVGEQSMQVLPTVVEASNGQQGGQQSYATQILSPQTAFLVREMMYSNIWGGGSWRDGTGWNGTGWRAQVLKRRDIGGKTGTTNDSKDTWYSGYAPGIVATVWVGFDEHNRTLGKTKPNPNLGKNQISGGEAGAKTSEPAWVDFMDVALKEVPEAAKILPAEIIRVRIDRETGLLTNKSDKTSMFEFFKSGTEPTEYVPERHSENFYNTDTSQLF